MTFFLHIPVPQAVDNLVFTPSTAVNITAVQFRITWNRPSERNGSYDYILEFSATQEDPHPDDQRRSEMRNIPLDGQLESYTFRNGIPFANYIITLIAVNIKLTRPGPSVTITQRTIAIREQLFITYNYYYVMLFFFYSSNFR